MKKNMMKQHLWMLVLAVASVCMGSCDNKDEEVKDNAPDLSRVMLVKYADSEGKGPAFEEQSGRYTYHFDEEGIEYAATMDGYLRITHSNVVAPEGSNSFAVSLSTEDGIIEISEDKDPMTDGILAYDLCYKVGPLEEAAYEVVIRTFGVERARFKLDFTATASGSLTVEKTDAP